MAAPCATSPAGLVGGGTLYGWLLAAFHWDHQPQGYGYWQALSEQVLADRSKAEDAVDLRLTARRFKASRL
jgi:hypothetical protein